MRLEGEFYNQFCREFSKNHKENNKDYQWVSTFPTDTPFFKKQILEDFLKKIKPEESKLFFIKLIHVQLNFHY